MRLFVSLALIALSTLVPFGAQARTMQISDMRRIVDVNSPKISPDGSKIACVVTYPDYANNRYRSDLLVIDVRTGKQRIIVHDRQDLEGPQWSPTGDRIAFIALSGESDTAEDQILVIPSTGGKATRLTSAPNGVDGRTSTTSRSPSIA